MVLQGIIYKIISLKGYGFIQGDDGVQYFMHADDVDKEEEWGKLKIQMRVEFTPKAKAGAGGNGLRATGTKVIR